MTAKALSKYLNRNHSDQKFFYITSDYTWGWSVEESIRKFSNTENTDIHQGVKTPFPRAMINDFREALEKAQESDAKVLMMVLFGDDMVRALNLAYEMGLTEKMQIVVPNLTLGMVRQVGRPLWKALLVALPGSGICRMKTITNAAKILLKPFQIVMKCAPHPRQPQPTVSFTSTRTLSNGLAVPIQGQSSAPLKDTATAS